MELIEQYSQLFLGVLYLATNKNAFRKTRQSTSGHVLGAKGPLVIL
jgi:hypothetical protein